MMDKKEEALMQEIIKRGFVVHYNNYRPLRECLDAGFLYALGFIGCTGTCYLFAKVTLYLWGVAKAFFA
jgi:hypothetical protein